MKKKPLIRTLLALAAVLILASLLSRRFREEPSPEAPQAVAKGRRASVPEEPVGLEIPSSNAPPAPAHVLANLSEHINQFIANARPFGLDQPVRAAEITYVRTNGHGKSVMVETAGHMYEFQGTTPRFFMSKHDCLNAVRDDPAARSRWHQARASWTKEEALAETYAIMARLGIKATVGRVEYEAVPMPVKTPAGERVEVTPFHTIWLHMTNDVGALQAQFRMGTSGPGRLVTFFSTVP